jgi:hypothetical protein
MQIEAEEDASRAEFDWKARRGAEAADRNRAERTLFTSTLVTHTLSSPTMLSQMESFHLLLGTVVTYLPKMCSVIFNRFRHLRLI